MPGPVSRESQNAVCEPMVQSEVDGVAPSQNQSRASGQSAGNSVESWSGSDCGLTQGAQAEGVSPAQLQERDRIGVAAFASVKEQLAKAIASEGSREQVRANDFSFVNAVSNSPQFERALASMSREEVKMWLEEAISAKRPNASSEDNAAVCERIMKRVDTYVLQKSERKLSRAVANQLNESASRFEAIASDPKQLAALRQQLTSLGGSDGDAIRSAFGVSGGLRSDAELKSALLERAGLMRHEGERVFAQGDNTRFRNMLLHSAMGPEIMEKAGVREGSWMSQGLERIKQRGEVDEEHIASAKKWSAVTMAVAMEASGIDSHVANALTAAAFGSLSVMQAANEVSAAKAGASAGTADQTAERAAKAKLAAATSGAVASTLAAGIGLPEGTPAKPLVEGATEWGIQTGEELVHHQITPQQQGAQGDAINRLKNAGTR